MEPDKIIKPTEIWQKMETEAGRREVAEYIWKARTAMAAQRVCEVALKDAPDEATQQMICEIIWECIFNVSIFVIMDYARQMVEAQQGDSLGDTAGSC